MWNRRQFLTRSGLGMAATAGTCLGFAGDNLGESSSGLERIPDGSASRGMITENTDEADIRRGFRVFAAAAGKALEKLASKNGPPASKPGREREQAS